MPGGAALWRDTEATVSYKPAVPARELTTGQLIGLLRSQLAELARDELALARAELARNGRHAGAGALDLAVAGALTAFGGLALLAAVIAAVAVALPVWAAALVIGGPLTIGGAFFGLRAVRRMKEGLAFLPRTADSLRADAESIGSGLRR